MKKFLIALVLVACTGLTVLADSASNEAKFEYNRGYDFYKIGQYDRSMAAFRRAIEIDPNYIDAYYNLGSILEYLHQDDAALAVFKQIIVRKPDDYESIYKAGNLSVKLGQYDKAKSYLALIPTSNSLYSKAQALISTIPQDEQKTETPNLSQLGLAENSEMTDNSTHISQTNGMYNNIPSPTGITTDSAGNVYIASFSDNIIYKVTPDGRQIVFIKNPQINGPIAMASDAKGNMYVSNYNSNNVVKITPTGGISVLINNVEKPYGMNITDGMLFVSSQGTNSVLRYKL